MDIPWWVVVIGVVLLLVFLAVTAVIGGSRLDPNRDDRD